MRLWSWPNGRLVRTFQGVGTHWGIKTLRFSDDSERLAAAAAGPIAVAVWDVRRGTEIARLPSSHPIAAPSPFVFLDRNRLLAAKNDGSIVEWDIRNAQTRVIGRPTGYVTDLFLVAKGRQLAYVGRESAAGSFSDVGVMDVATGQTVRGAQEANDLTRFPLLADPDSSWVLTRNHAWDQTTGRPLPFGRRFDSDYRDAAVSPDGRLIYKSVNQGIYACERLTRIIHK